MKPTSVIRVIAFVVLTYFLLEFTIDSGEELAISKYPIIWLILGIVFILSVTMEIIVGALQTVMYAGLSEDAKLRYNAAEISKSENRFVWFKKNYKKMMGAKPLTQEQEIVMDHNYDGIRELDNKLPPWWVYLFYASIIFAVVYLARYHIFNGTDQIMEYQNELAQAKIDIDEYKKNNKDLVDINTVELLTDAGELAAGKAIFTENCIACHKADGGGGIGPNLTDDHWILGGGIKNVFHTISEGGRAGKGMISWKSDLKPSQIAEVASYVLSLQGTKPAEPKPAEGEIWKDDKAAGEKSDAAATNHTATTEVAKTDSAAEAKSK